MLDGIANVIARIVFSGADGRVLIPLLIILLIVIIGQAEDFMKEVKEVWEEGE